MGSLKGYAPHPDATGAEAPLKTVNSLLKPTTRKLRRGLHPAGLQEHPLPNNLPGRFKTGTSTTAGNMQLVETLALELASATEIRFNLLRLLMATLFATAPGEEPAADFREEAFPEEIQSIARGMLEVNQAMVDTTSTLLGNSIVWRCQQELKKSSLPAEFRQGLISAPFDAETLFGHKPVTAVVEESHDERINRAITSLSTSHTKGTSSSHKRGRSADHGSRSQTHNYDQHSQPFKRQRGSSSQRSSNSRGRSSRGRGTTRRQTPQ